MPVTRGKEQAVIFTDDRKELLKAVSRPDDPMSATELSESTEQELELQNELIFGQGRPGMGRDPMDRGRGHGR